MKPMIANLEKLLDGPRDGPMLRFALGNAWLEEDPGKAVAYFREALLHDPEYSAAWRALGKALEQTAAPAEALQAYRQGIPVAERKGDKQAAREMTVFARRIERNLAAGTD